MQFIHLTSAWAARQPRKAISLIILLEGINALLGIMVGSALLKELSGWVLMALLVGVVFINKNLKQYAHIRLLDLISQARFSFQKHIFFGLFSLNLFAYTIAGGIMGRVVSHPEASSNLYGSITTTITLSASSSDDKKIAFRENAFKRTQERKSDTGRRIGYFALFILGVALAYVGAALACALACSGAGLGAVFVLLLSIGVLAGGFYFLGRGVDKETKRYKDMTRNERKREGRRYLWTLLGTAGALTLWILIAGLSE